MNTLTFLIAIIIALIGYPIGLLIARLTKEELAGGRRWFKMIIFSCILAVFFSLIIAKGEVLLFLIASFIFILLVALASLRKIRVK